MNPGSCPEGTPNPHAGEASKRFRRRQADADPSKASYANEVCVSDSDSDGDRGLPNTSASPGLPRKWDHSRHPFRPHDSKRSMDWKDGSNSKRGRSPSEQAQPDIGIRVWDALLHYGQMCAGCWLTTGVRVLKSRPFAAWSNGTRFRRATGRPSPNTFASLLYSFRGHAVRRQILNGSLRFPIRASRAAWGRE